MVTLQTWQRSTSRVSRCSLCCATNGRRGFSPIGSDLARTIRMLSREEPRDRFV